MTISSPRSNSRGKIPVAIDWYDEKEHRRKIAEKTNELITHVNRVEANLTRPTASSSHTGDTNETSLDTVVIPGETMGITGMVKITSVWTMTNNANNKTIRVRFGAEGDASSHAGTAYMELTFTTIATYMETRTIFNLGSQSSQVGPAADALGGGGSSTSAVVTSTEDTASPTEIEFSAELADSGDSITLEAYSVEVIQGLS